MYKFIFVVAALFSSSLALAQSGSGSIPVYVDCAKYMSNPITEVAIDVTPSQLFGMTNLNVGSITIAKAGPTQLICPKSITIHYVPGRTPFNFTTAQYGLIYDNGHHIIAFTSDTPDDLRLDTLVQNLHFGFVAPRSGASAGMVGKNLVWGLNATDPVLLNSGDGRITLDVEYIIVTF